MARQRKVQKFVNVLHFVTASSFALLIVRQWPEIMKWIIPAISVTAGIIGITLPTSSENNERQIYSDIDRVSELSGRIVKVQSQLGMASDKLSQAVESEALTVLGMCTALAKRYELDQAAASAGALPRFERKSESH